MEFKFNDGGRAEAGYKGETGDCVVRAISIATQTPYKEVYSYLYLSCLSEKPVKWRKREPRIKRKSHPRKGIRRPIYEKYLFSKGWKWIPCMGIGTGCKVHLKKEELPSGRLIVSLSRHLCAVVDGVIHDTYDCSREENRCVYGYYQKG